MCNLPLHYKHLQIFYLIIAVEFSETNRTEVITKSCYETDGDVALRGCVQAKDVKNNSGIIADECFCDTRDCNMKMCDPNDCDCPFSDPNDCIHHVQPDGILILFHKIHLINILICNNRSQYNTLQIL